MRTRIQKKLSSYKMHNMITETYIASSVIELTVKKVGQLLMLGTKG